MKPFEVGDEVKIKEMDGQNTPFIGETGCIVEIFGHKVCCYKVKLYNKMEPPAIDYYQSELEHVNFFKSGDFEVC